MEARGSWRSLVEVPEGHLVLTGWERMREVTANQAAMTGVLKTIEEILNSGYPVDKIILHTMFQYLARGYNHWSPYWIANNFRGKVSGEEIRNRSYWEKLLSYRNILEVQWHARNTHPRINEAMDFCWELYDNPSLVPPLPPGFTWHAKPNDSSL